MAANTRVPLAESGILGTIDTTVNEFMEPIATAFNDIVFFPLTIGDFSFPLVVAWLIIAGIVMTFYFGFIQFRGLKVSTEVVRGKFSTKQDPGEVPHFQALTSALSGTVGLATLPASARPWHSADPAPHSG